MSERDDPSLPWCLYFLGLYIFGNVKLRMKLLVGGPINTVTTGGIKHFAKLTGWYLEDYWREVKRWVRRYILRQGWKGMP